MSDTLTRKDSTRAPRPGEEQRWAVRGSGVQCRRRSRRHGVVVVSAVVLLLAVGFALFPSVFASGDPLVGGTRPTNYRARASHTGSAPTTSAATSTHGSCTAPALSLTATLVAVGIALVAGSMIGSALRRRRRRRRRGADAHRRRAAVDSGTAAVAGSRHRTRLRHRQRRHRRRCAGSSPISLE